MSLQFHERDLCFLRALNAPYSLEPPAYLIFDLFPDHPLGGGGQEIPGGLKT